MLTSAHIWRTFDKTYEQEVGAARPIRKLTIGQRRARCFR